MPMPNTWHREIRNLVSLTSPIRENRPIITKYQDFWNKAKQITALFKELKPLAKSDRDLLWKKFNDLCRDVKEKQKTEYGTLESLSQQHLDEIMKLADLAQLPPGAPAREIHELVERGQALKNAGDTLGRFKHAMIAKHKKACFDKIQEYPENPRCSVGVGKGDKAEAADRNKIPCPEKS